MNVRFNCLRETVRIKKAIVVLLLICIASILLLIISEFRYNQLHSHYRYGDSAEQFLQKSKIGNFQKDPFPDYLVKCKEGGQNEERKTSLKQTTKSQQTTRIFQNSPKNNVPQIATYTCNAEITNFVIRGSSESKAKRKFKRLPKRYSKVLESRKPAPNCGSDGLLFPRALLENASKKLWMIYLVKSAPTYVDNRMAVRRTWAKKGQYKNKNFAVVFLVGIAEQLTDEENLRKENEAYGDILQCDLEDNYKALPLKVCE